MARIDREEVLLLRSITTRITVLVSLLVLGASMAFLAMSLWVMDQSLEKQLSTSFERTGKIITSSLDVLKDKTENDARIIGAMPILTMVLEAANQATIEDTAKTYERDFFLSLVELYDADSEPVFDSKVPSSPKLQVLLNNALKGQTASAFFSLPSGIAVLAASPVGFNDDPLGVLLVGRYLDQSFVHRTADLAQTDLTILQNGRIIASSLVGEPLERLRKHIPLDQIQRHDRFQQSSHFIFSTVSVRDWDKNQGSRILFHLDRNTVYQSRSRMFELLTILGCGILGITALTSWLISRSVSRPLATLHSTTEGIISSNDLSRRTPEIGDDEVGHLSKSFNRLLSEVEDSQKRLDETNRTLEERVHEKTIHARKVQRELSEMFDTIPEGIFTFDDDFSINQYYSLHLMEMLQLDKTPVGRNALDLLFEGAIEKEVIQSQVLHGLTQIFVGDANASTPVAFDLSRLVGKTQRIIRIAFQPIKNRDGRVHRILAVLKDVTELRQLQDEAFVKKVEKSKLEAEFQAAKTVQETLLPTSTKLPNVHLEHHYQSAEKTGGDWYYWHFDPGSQCLLAFVGDVTGHGISSALATGVICGAVRTCLQQEFQPGAMDIALIDIARKINNTLLATCSRSNRILALSLLSLNLETGEGLFLNAGQRLPYILSADKLRVLRGAGSCLGLINDPMLHPTAFQLTPGDTLFIYTDGLLENPGLKGEVVRERELRAQLRACYPEPHRMKETVLSLVDKSLGGNKPEDDFTFLFIQWQKDTEMKAAKRSLAV